MRRTLAVCLLSTLALPAAGCEVALLLAVDISGSVDAREFAVQMQGLAEGLTDPVVSEALVRGQSAVALMQWTGSSRQVLSVGWTRIAGPQDVEALAARITRLPRVWTEFSTAIGQAMTYGSGVFDRAPACRRRVMDISSDGRSNEGIEPAEVKPAMDSLAIIVNALVIRGDDEGLPAWFGENVMTGPNAFVVTAEDYDEYPERMRRKLRRETERAVSALPAQAIPAAYGP
jgi:Ca-activated chloride channel family protein